MGRYQINNNIMKKLLLCILAVFILVPLSAQKMKLTKAEKRTLASAEISDFQLERILTKFPRPVGKNAFKESHGKGPVIYFAVLVTADGQQGIGQVLKAKVNKDNLHQFKAMTCGKKITDLLDEDTFLVKPEYRDFDIAVYDLVGVMLNKPVYKLFGKPASHSVHYYTGMTYFDDLDKDNREDGMKYLLDNCRYDYSLGYRAFKAKIGRGDKWMEREEGLQRDIDVVRMIHENFPDCTILVDANNAYSVEECIRFIEGVAPAKIFWFEEPFHENEAQYRELSEWKKKNAPEMLLVDGEFKPDRDLVIGLGEKGVLDTYNEDICDYGFTNWIELMPRLLKAGMNASPHGWAMQSKSIYASHFAMAFGHVPTIEGVTNFTDKLDWGFTIENGFFIPSEKPGFGITLKK